MSAGPRSPIVLASASPRRRRLFAWLGLPYETCSTDTPEDLDVPLASEPSSLAEHLAAEKARAARASLGPDSAVVTCDTLVVHEGEVLGKPEDLEHAYRMLRRLSGKNHVVVTGVALLAPGAEEPETFSVVTNVRMRELSEDDIRDWAGSGELLGCAGAYNIEHHLGQVAEDECFQNVAGLPLCHVWRALDEGAIGDLPSELDDTCARCDESRGLSCRLGPTLVRRPGTKG